ncbi:protein tramtrack, beta isoform-like isoform X2 [Zophobas morio]|uniref:protein tramtrack, beta isoform-like isoform X2 n=1 Tax=Zophobas morio TaxID=2755281 RepID=UPI003083207D
MASEQFSLCWDNFHKNMSSGMNSLLENEDLVDVTLAVEGKYLKAHKMVLSVCSPYFRELFKMNPCKHPIVFMKDVSYIAMSDLLQFMYQGEVQVSQDNLTTFIKTAEALQIKGLTGDGNGSAECDNDQDEPRPAEIEPPKMTAPPPRPKKVHQTPTPPAKRPRLSVPEQASAQQTIAKTEPAAVSSAPSNENLIQFKMEPYDQGQSTVTIPDDNTDETFTDDPLDETNADDGNEDYSMMEGGDEEPQAGTSADGTAGEGQDDFKVKNTPKSPGKDESTENSGQKVHKPLMIKGKKELGIIDDMSPSSGFINFIDNLSIPSDSKLNFESSHSVVDQLRILTQQNREMLSLLKLQASLTTDLCIEPPVGLPVKTSDDLTALETYLMEPGNFSDMTFYLSRLGGSTVTSVTNKIMKRCLSDELATTYNFCGHRNKKAFNTLLLRNVVVP